MSEYSDSQDPRLIDQARYRLLVFDLDDTLVDTFGQLVKPAAREACLAMIEAGLDTDLETCVGTREKLFTAYPKADVYERLVEEFGIREGCLTDPDTVRQAGHRAYFHREVSPDFKLAAAVPELLQKLGRNHDLRLVTSGYPPTQAQKVRILKLQPYFSQIVYVPPESSKKAAFEEMLRLTGIMPRQVLCIGDRLDREISAAKSLGMDTCRILGGEFAHLQPNSTEEVPDFQVRALDELPRWLSK